MDHVAAHLGVRKDSIYRWIEGRRLPAQKIGKLWKLKLSEVDAWVRATQGSASGQTDGDPDAGRRSDTAAAASSRTAEPRRHILVIDDDDVVRATLRDFLEDEGYEALLAVDGADALVMLRSGHYPRPSLILLDLGMPNMDGWSFREEQRRDLALSGIPLVVVTAERRDSVPGVPVLRKPLNLDELAAVIGSQVATRET